jgi:micrococcal nuclease
VRRESAVGRTVLLAILLVAAITLLGRMSGGGGPVVSSSATAGRSGTTVERSPSARTGATGATGLGSAPIASVEEAHVVRVVDGDTIIVDRGRGSERLRYIGMNTPETVAPGQPVESGGPEAADANTRLVAGQTVELERDVSETDRYGRLLRDVWLPDPSRPTGWLLVNLELVRLGFAQVTTYPPDVRYVDALLDAQRAARAAGRGLWAEPASAPAASSLTLVGAGGCHPSYSPCVPVVGDLDCPDVREMGLAPVRVIGPDDYRLDGDGDGLGCE